MTLITYTNKGRNERISIDGEREIKLSSNNIKSMMRPLRRRAVIGRSIFVFVAIQYVHVFGGSGKRQEEVDSETSNTV